jgi:hypothetical protein
MHAKVCLTSSNISVPGLEITSAIWSWMSRSSCKLSSMSSTTSASLQKALLRHCIKHVYLSHRTYIFPRTCFIALAPAFMAFNVSIFTAALSKAFICESKVILAPCSLRISASNIFLRFSANRAPTEWRKHAHVTPANHLPKNHTFLILLGSL